MPPERWTLQGIVDHMADALRGPLPGPRAQMLMAPNPRPALSPPATPTRGRPAAALLLLYPVTQAVHVLLTVRSRDLPNHRGQISLPGGLVEENESLRTAALREAREEVGLTPELVNILGSLSAVFIPVSGFILHPFVGTVRELPKLRPNPGEVERVLEVPLTDLADPARLHVEQRALAGREARIPYFDVEGEKLWGATAMILAELLWILGAPPRPPGSPYDPGTP